jgi:carboxyl-terminal processing protease
MRLIQAAALALVLLVPLLVPTPVAAADSNPTLAIRIWGLAKYHHPELTACRVAWDDVLTARWASIEVGGADALQAMLAAAGPTPQRTPDAQTPAWIREATIPELLRAQLAWLAAQQPASQCYVRTEYLTGPASFNGDTVAHEVAQPNRAQRALAAARWWNAIEYFFPYLDVIGRDWGDALAEYLPAVLDAADFSQYEQAIRTLTAAIEDSHAHFVHADYPSHYGSGAPRLLLRPIDGIDVVVQHDLPGSGVALGDQLIAVDGETFALRKQRAHSWAYGSNPAWKESFVLRRALSGAPNPGRFRLRRPDGSEYEVLLPRAHQGITSAIPDRPMVSSVELDRCRIGVVDMARLQPADVDSMLETLADTDALLFDLRNYPNGTMWPIVDRLYDAPTSMALLTRPLLTQPGRFIETSNVLGGARPGGPRGRILLLADERTLSQAEFSLMGLQATGRALLFGSQTAAADGNITLVRLPGRLSVYFTGLGVFHPDGRPTQRIGIVPDLHVYPTRDGVIAGQDEVMQAALDCRWIDGTPPRRIPAQGLYFDVARSGEGIDVHHNRSGAIGVLSYGFDDEGEPEWILASGDSETEDWQRGFMRSTADRQMTALHGYALDFHDGPYTTVCAAADQGRLHPRGRWSWPVDSGEAEACVRPLLLSKGGGWSGLWAGADDELGWGISLHHVDGVAAVVVYAYDNDGQPRWLIGTGPWDGASTLELALVHVRGFCRACAPVSPQHTPAGELRLEPASAGDDHGALLDIDAAFGPGARWQRARMPLFRVTEAPEGP